MVSPTSITVSASLEKLPLASLMPTMFGCLARAA